MHIINYQFSDTISHPDKIVNINAAYMPDNSSRVYEKNFSSLAAYNEWASTTVVEKVYDVGSVQVTYSEAVPGSTEY